MFLTTRDNNKIYKFINSACKRNCEILLKENLKLSIFKRKKFPSFHFFLFFFYILVSGKIIKRNRAKIKYEDIEIGKFIISNTFYNFETYVNKLKFYKLLIKNLLIAGSIINSCNYLYKKKNIKGIYVDHCSFLNGIIYSFFAQRKIPIYTNNYPHGIYFVNFKRNNKKYLKKFENTLKVNLEKKVTKLHLNKADNKLSKLLKNKNFIPWLLKARFTKIKKINYKDFNYIIYPQAFTDGQMYYGNDGFESNLDWLEFTLNHFIKTEKKVLIKPHPNFYNDAIAIYSKWDKQIYDIVVQKYKRYKNLYFLKQPIHNYKLLKKLNKDCVVILKNSSAIMETAYMNFKTISSEYIFFNKKFDISNMWKNKKEYLKLLNYDYTKLREPNKNDLLKMVYTLFYIHNNNYNATAWYPNIIRNHLRLSKKNFNKLFIIKARSKTSNSKLNKINKLYYEQNDTLINKISKEIYEVKI